MDQLTSLHEMALFVEVARTGNFSRASRNLGVPVATLSRRISAVERAFGVRLFNRSTRKVELSEAGRRYFERCAHLAWNPTRRGALTSSRGRSRHRSWEVATALPA